MWRKLFKNEWLGSRFCILFTLFLLANTAFAGVRLVRTGETYEHLSDLLGVGNSQLQDNDVLELDSDMDVDFPFAHFTAKNVTLRGNGYMLRYKEGASSLKLTDAYLLMEDIVIDGSQLGFADFPIFVLDKNSSEGSYLKLDDKTIVQGFQCGCLAQVAWSKISGGIFRQNSSVQGGLAMFDLVDATIASTKIIDNEVSAEGNATLVSLKSSTMVNSIVANNHISTSGASSTAFAIRVLKANAGDRVGGTLINSTVVENGANLYAAGSCLVHNNILYHNGGEIIISGTLPTDCMTEDPHLYDDYSLMSTSPCIDKGNNQPYQDRVAQGHFDLYDYFGEARIEGGKIDIGASEYRSRCGDVGYMDQRAPVLRPGKFLPTDRVGEMVNLDKIPDFPSVEEIAALFIDDCSEVLVDSTMEFVKRHNCDWEVKAIYTIRDAANNESKLSPLVITYSGGNPKMPVVVGELPLTQRADVTQCLFSVPDFKETLLSSLADGSYDWEIIQEPVAGSAISENVTVKITVSDYCGNQIDTSVLVIVPQPLKLTVASAEANCFGVADGEIKGTIQGGTAPYQLTWTRDDLLVGSEEVNEVDLTDLADGMYKLTIKDANGCQKSVSVNIAQLTQTITVKAADSSKVYDGEPLEQHRYEVIGLLEEGDRVANVKIEGTITESGRVENVVKSFQILRGEQDVTCFYDTVMKSGSLVVSKRKISLLALSKNKDYDGTALVLKSWKISNGSLADGEVLSSVKIEGSIVNVGVVTNKISDAVILRGEKDVTDNYDIDYKDGRLEVLPRSVKVTVKGETKEVAYSGVAQKLTGYEWSASTTLYQAADFSYAGDSIAAGIEIGTYQMKLSEDQFTNNNQNFSVTFEVEDGWLKIDPLAVTVTITGHTRTTIYNGSAQDTTGYEWRANSALYQAADFSYEGDSIAEGTEIGTYAMNLTEENFTNKNDNYTVTFEVEDGWLKINPLAVTVTITGHTRTTIYNGSAQDTTGYEWNANTNLYQVADFSYEGDSLAKGTEIGTYAMNLKKENFANNNDNYTVTFEVSDGWLKINPLAVKVSIAGHTRTTIYNGEEQDTTGYEWSANTNLYQATDFSYAGDSIAAGKEIGTYAMNLKKENFTNKNDNYTVTFEVEDGWLKINPLAVTVTITGHTKTTIYNGASQDTTGYEWSANSILYQAADFSYAGDSIAAGKEIGTYQMKLSEDQFTNNNPNYNVTFEVSDGWLKINPLAVTVTITGHTRTAIYNGFVQDTTGYEWSANTNLYQAADFSYAGDSLAAGKEIGTYQMKLSEDQFTNNNPNYNVTFEVADGWLKIDPLAVTVTITGHTRTTIYNGSAQDTTGYEWSANTLLYQAADFSYEGDSLAKGTEIGTYAMNLKKENFTNKNDNYTVTFDVEDGWLKINPLAVTVTITGHTRTTIYNGAAQDTTGYEWSASSILYQVADFSYAGDSLAKGTEIGTYAMNLKKENFTNKNDNYTVTFEVEDGWLKINPLAVTVTITGHTRTTIYNGSAQDTTGYEWRASSALYQAADFSYAGDSLATGTEIGTYAMNLKRENFTNNNDNYTVTFEVEDGWLKIDPLAVTVTIAGHTRTTIYNGSAQDTTGYEWRANTMLYQAADFSYEGDSLAKGTEIGTYAMNLKKENFTNKNDNYTVTFEVEDGWLKINPLAVTVAITGHTRTTIYNGSAQDTTGYEWRASSALYQAADFSYEGDSLAKGTEIGNYAMNLKKENFANNNNNYTVTFEVEDGWLKINPLAIKVSITGHTRTTIYNGSAQDTTGYEWSANSTLYQAADFSYAGDSIAEGIDVGTYYMSLKEEHFSNINKNFEVTFSLLSDGKLEITPLDLSVDIIGHTKVVAYNGVAQKVTGYEWEASTALYHKADFSYAGDSLATGVTLGTYPMELSPAQFSNQNPNFGKVVFRVVSDGYIQITPITTPITITANSSKAVYDGSPFSNDGFKYTRNVLVAGDVLKAVVEGTIKNVGETANVVTSYRVVRIDAATKEEVDVTENYTFTDPEDGKLTVTKRAVLLRSASDTKVYDGKALTNAQVEVVGDLSVGGFVFGEGAAYDVTGSITEVGSADNLFTYRLRSNTLAENYDIRVEYGTLTVTLVESAIVITANSQSKLYDGEPLLDPGFTFTPNVLAKGDVIEATVVGEVTAVGSVANRVESFKVVRGELDVTKNYTFGESKEGILTVTPRQVILTSATDSKPYDRQPLVNGQVKIGGDGFAKGEGATFQVTGSLTEEGSVENSFTYVLTENTVSTNYLIQSVTGLLTVTPRPTAIVLDYGYAVKADTLGGFADKDFESPADPLRKGYAFESWKPALPALLPLDTLRSVAQWRLLEYKVALDTFGQISYTVEDRATIDLADYTPSRIGYDFTGWVDEKGYGVDHVNTSEARSIALKATWRMANYAIHYLSAGKEWKQVPMTYGETIASVPQPVRNGYLFKGWIPALPATMPNKDLTVEADWEIIHYSLMLVDEGRDAGTLSYTVEDDDFYLDKLADRPGQEFSGWTMAGELLDFDEVSGQYIFHPSEVASDALLEAAWTIVSNEFTIDFYVDGAKYKTLRLMAGANTASYIATVRDPRDKAGYRFGGWDLDLPEEMPRKNLEVSAVWKPISYKLILLNEQGVETYLTNYTIEDEVLLPNFEDPEGKREFLGWTDGKNYYKTFDPSKFLKDVELVEAWKLRTFQVIYFVSGKEYARDTFHVGDSIAKIPDPEDYIEGYAFSGWSETPTYMPTEDVKVTSYYELGGYTLTYKSEGKVVKSVRYLYQAPISPSRGISKYGYEFKYWAGVPSNMPGRDIEVEAVYDVATYRLVLRDGTEVIDSLHYTIYDEDIKLPVLDERGRVFRGWYDGTKTITTVKKGSYASNMDLVANWTYINYTLIFMVEGVEYKKKNTMRCGDEITLPKEPVKEGAEFIRWEGMPTDGLMPDDDLTLTAVFSTEVGETLVVQSPSVELYSEDLTIHLLYAEGKSVTVVNLNGLILWEGESNAVDYEIPVRRHGAYLVRVGQEVKKILVK